MPALQTGFLNLLTSCQESSLLQTTLVLKDFSYRGLIAVANILLELRHLPFEGTPRFGRSLGLWSGLQMPVDKSLAFLVNSMHMQPKLLNPKSHTRQLLIEVA
jgi:hypothetical protein